MKNIIFLGMITVLAAFSTSCEEKGDVVDIYVAQQCLNQAPETDKPALLKCLDPIAAIDTAEANVVRCSILLTAGGVTSSRLAKAMADQDSGGDSSMMTNFSFNTYGSSNKQKAREAKASCKKSGQKGLMGLGGFANTGTIICNGVDTCSTTFNAGQIDSNMSDCANAANSCTAEDKKEIGQTVIDMNEIYCSGGNSDLDECKTITEALVNVDPTDPDAVAAAILAKWVAQ